MALSSPVAFEHQFNGSDLFRLFDLLPDEICFIKDCDEGFMLLRRCGQQYCGVRGEIVTIGKKDPNFFPRGRAAVYLMHDDEVMRTGRPIIKRGGSGLKVDGLPGLIVTSKNCRCETRRVRWLAALG